MAESTTPMRKENRLLELHPEDKAVPELHPFGLTLKDLIRYYEGKEKEAKQAQQQTTPRREYTA